MKINPGSMAKASSRHPWRTIGIWAVVFMLMGTISGKLLADVLTSDIAFTNRPESLRAQDLMEQNVTGKKLDTEFVIVQNQSVTADDPSFSTYVDGVKAKLQSLGKGTISAPITSYFDVAASSPDQAAAMISKDKHAVLISVPIASQEASTVAKIRTVIPKEPQDGFSALLAGPATMNADFTKVAEEDLKKGEGIGLMVALIVLIIVFGALVAALLPISQALVAIPVALGGVAIIGQFVHFNLFVENIVTMIGLAVGIDYSLFIVARYREERRKGRDKYDAIFATGGSASRAVFFSGLTVVIALSGMFIIPTTIFRSMATGAILVVLASIAASLTLLPALLGLLGDKINWPRFSKRAHAEGDPDPRGGFWDRVSRSVMSHAVVYLVIGVAILGSLTAVYFTIHKGTTQNVSTLPDEVESKQAFEILAKNFAGGQTQPVQILIQGDLQSAQVKDAVDSLRTAIGNDSAFSSQTQVVPGKVADTEMVNALFAGDPLSSESISAVKRLRSDIVPAAFAQAGGTTVLVGGDTAFFTDFLQLADTYQPLVLAFVLGLSFLLLMVVFRSLVVPAKAVIMNLLSVGAAYGMIVLVFQHGVGIGIFNAIGFKFQQVDAIEAWIPLLLFSILFGLSMDYHVFLLSRIRERYDQTGDNAESVAYGLRTTGAIITGAALIMVAVFTAFAAGRLVPLQQMGFGLAVAVFMDATIVRTILVPASMKLLGDRNWYLPKWLQWLPHLNVEGHVAPTVIHTDEAEGPGEPERQPANV